MSRLTSLSRLVGLTKDQSLTRLHSRPMSTVPDHENLTVTLPSARVLGYATYGPETGEPIYFFHGTPGSRLDGRYFSKAAEKLNARIISLERPGLGITSPDPRRTLLTWPDDVLAVADHLGHKTFRVFGMSGGGPYALACALSIPKERLVATGVLAGMGPLSETGILGQGFSFMGALSLIVWNYFPTFAKWYARNYIFNLVLTGRSAEFGEKMRKAFALIKNEEERKLYEEAGFLDTLLESMDESFKQGELGYFLDGDLICGTWPFKLAEVGAKDTAPILLWNGGKDGQTPLPLAMYMCAKLGGTVKGPRSEDEKVGDRMLRVYEGENHGTMIARYPEDILADLLEA